MFEQGACAHPRDVAQYVVNWFAQRQQSVTTIKLQKLVYYSQVWSLVWDDKPLFDEDFQAWINGPVVRSLFDDTKGYYYSPICIAGADPNLLTENQKDTIDRVLEHYGDLTSSELVQLSHSEAPWKDARNGLPSQTPSNAIISKASIAQFYSGLLD